MEKVKKYWIIFLSLVISIGAVAFLSVRLFNFNFFEKKDLPQQEIAKTAENPGEKQAEKIPEAVKEIMENNVAGTVLEIKKDSLTLETGTGQQDFMINGDTFFYLVSDNKIENKKISDIKKGMDIYIQFDKETRTILTATIK